MTHVPPGWYPDPSGAPGLRHLDGTTRNQQSHVAGSPTGATQEPSDEQRPAQAAVANMGDVVALWYVHKATKADFVNAARDLLAAGADGPWLRLLAAEQIRDYPEELASEQLELVDSALREIGLPFDQKLKGAAAAEQTGLIVMARRTLSGTVTPEDFARFARDGIQWPRLEQPSDDLKRLARDLLGMCNMYDLSHWEYEADADDKVMTVAWRVLALEDNEFK